jgi:peptidoglycan/LPS O-acetylase OafA/YrhL
MPYLVALTLGLLGNIFFFGDPTRGQYLLDFWSSPIDWHIFMRHLIFLGAYNTDKFDPPIWSLVYEMRISLFFPFLCAIALKLRPGQSLIMAICISCGSLIAGRLLHTPIADQLIFSTLHFAAFFVIGIYLARQRKRISESFLGIPHAMRIGLGLLSALLYVYGAYAWLHMAPVPLNVGRGTFADWFTVLGASGLIVFAQNSRWCNQALLWAPLQIVGKMSYGLYLIHDIVIFILVHLLYGELPFLLVLGLCLVVSLAVSWVFYLWIELPFISMGRKLSERFRERAAPITPQLSSS